MEFITTNDGLLEFKLLHHYKSTSLKTEVISILVKRFEIQLVFGQYGERIEVSGLEIDNSDCPEFQTALLQCRKNSHAI